MTTMPVLRFAAALTMIALALGAGSAAARTAALDTPSGLHAFLLRTDEPSSTSFNRTPSFSWNPVSGATTYQFQLSTSSSFRDNGIIYADHRLTSPVAAPAVTLPWITGNPHSLYARVRAVTQTTTGPWSPAFGFDVVPPPPPTPLPSYPGLIRWTPVPGATGYQIWLIDANKMEVVYSNVLDEREFYTLHQSSAWTGTVRWRIRALRSDTYNQRINQIPVSTFGAWSPVYSSSNSATSGGPIQLRGTVADVYSNGSDSAPAHRLMPAFLFSGNQSLAGTPAELFRVYVFTDKQCLNPVLIGSVTGAPAFSPRPYGTLTMPTLPTSLQSSRSRYLGDQQPHSQTTNDFGYDGTTLALSEQAKAATPTTAIPTAPGEATGSAGSSGSAGSAGASSSAGSAGPGGLSFAGDPGAPINLWDTEWPNAGYYWTVIPVGAVSPGALTTFVRSPGAKVADTSVPIAGDPGFNIGDTVTIGAETVTITGIGDGTISVTALKFAHTEGQQVDRVGGGILYVDLEMPQDACAAGRVARFGKSSEPALTSAGDLFATGLSPLGRLTSALHTASFYGSPLVSWTPALGAEAYQVQWSKTKYPFVAEDDPGAKTKGFLTTGTSSVLPIGKTPGTWWYRVRGFDYSLPTGAQQMSWSDPAKVVLTKPKFKITSSAGSKRTFKLVP
jgi:hypothetical protein